MAKRCFLISILILSAFVDAPSYVSVGPVSLMGALTILYTIALGMFLVRQPKSAWNGFKRIWPMSCLLLLSTFQCVLSRFSLQEAQNVCLLWVFVTLLVVTMSSEREGPDEAEVGRVLLGAMAFAALSYALIVLGVGFGPDAIGASSWIAARSFALYALLGLGLLLGRWAMGSRISLYLALALIVIIALSLSRTALVAGVALIPISRFRSPSLRLMWRTAFLSGVTAVLLLYFVSQLDPLRSRFIGDKSYSDFLSGDASVDTSGRLAAWGVTLDSYIESPWLGKGPGSANSLVAETLYEFDLDHPLNEYLRFLHDSGLLGLALLLAGCAQLLVFCHRALRKSGTTNPALAGFHWGTFLALVAVLLSMFTDNTSSYLFVMAPLAVLLGTSLRSLDASVAGKGAG